MREVFSEEESQGRADLQTPPLAAATTVGVDPRAE
jgi:hypothetical protein